MEKKKNTVSSQTVTRIVYGAVIAILCITAIVVGIVAAANKRNTPDEPNLPIDGENGNPPEENPPEENPSDTKTELSFALPVSGGVLGTEYDEDTPVFSNTLGEWRLHLGIDILTDGEAPVFAAEDGVITGIYKDARFGYTVEITHAGEHKTVYSNLKNETLVSLEVGDEVAKGDRIGTVGDSAISEIADEPHLHFELFVGGVPKNPTDYLRGLEENG
ncbi:MAG: M23 family metallopeptidase [Clostridia bacterium]|nr:M23 family metallopeptidase [Clostridia bacterium]